MTVHGKIFACVLGTLGFALPAVAQEQRAAPCTDRNVMTKHLASKYHEIQQGAGLQSRSRIIEVWASDGGSWTIVATDASGVSCILASGTHWHTSDPVEAQPSGVPG